MKLLFSLIALLAVNGFGAEWSIRREAAKGENVCAIPYEPRALESVLSALPAGHPEANADIRDGLKPAKSSAELLGTFNGRKVIAVELEVPQTYHARYFLIIAEVEDGKFMPISVQQFAPGVHGHGKPTFKPSKSDFSVTITSETIGTDPSEKAFRITCDLKAPPKTEEISDGNGGKPRNIPRDAEVFRPPPDFLKIQFPEYGGGPPQPYAATAFTSITTLIETPECKVMWTLAQPPTTATPTVVGGLFVLTLKEGEWHTTDAKRFEASGKSSAARAVPTSHGSAAPHLTVTLHQGGRGETWEESASYVVKDGKLSLALPTNQQPADQDSRGDAGTPSP